MHIEKNKIQKFASKWGNKATANWIFHKLGLFNNPLLIFSPRISVEKIRQSINKSEIDFNRLTIRFSYENKINMPRGFFLSLESALKFIEEKRKKYSNATIIVHEFISPLYSYELYWDNENFYIQILPGVWEMENSNPPDIILQTGNKITIHNYKNTRICKYIDKNCKIFFSSTPPLTINELKDKFDKVNTLKSKINQLIYYFDPLFCHFIENLNGNLFFINARQTSLLDLTKTGYRDPKIFHRISNIKDFKSWHGKPVLFDMVCSRGNDTSFIEAVREISRSSIKEVYVNYGVLSHPAVILREFGVDVKQVHTFYNTKILNINKID